MGQFVGKYHNRLDKKYKYIFLERASEEFKEAIKDGTMNNDYFEDYKWNMMINIAERPEDFHTNRAMKSVQDVTYWRQEYDRIRNSWTYRIGNCVTIIPRIALRFVRCIRKHGLVYTFTTSFIEFVEGKAFGK